MNQDMLETEGWTVIEGLLSAGLCQSIAEGFDNPKLYRSKVVMERHGYGRGVYQYFAYPLPDPIQTLRQDYYPQLAQIANRWNKLLDIPARYPATHEEFKAICHSEGQKRPTPLLLRYEPGDYNCLHQDLYGPLVFPLQMAILLSEPGRDFTGGEFVITEQRPRRQSRPIVVPLKQGDAVVFPVHHRPVESVRGVSRATMRHGVSRLISGRRHTLGVIFHDAA